jgi:hypothetical protein
MRPPSDKDDLAHYSKIDETADCLELEVFPKLPRIFRYDDQGQRLPPKGGRWVDDPKGRNLMSALAAHR